MPYDGLLQRSLDKVSPLDYIFMCLPLPLIVHEICRTASHQQEVSAVGKFFASARTMQSMQRRWVRFAPSSPIIFLKPSTAVIENGEAIVLPAMSDDVHHEVELTVLLGKKGKNIPQSKAFDYVEGYGIGLDMTMRDRQKEAKAAGNPWSIAKGFDTSAPLSPFISKDQVNNPDNLEITITRKWQRTAAFEHIEHDL